MQSFTIQQMTASVQSKRGFESALVETKKVMNALETTLPVWINHKGEIAEMCLALESHLTTVCKRRNVRSNSLRTIRQCGLILEMALERLHDIRDQIVEESF